MSRSRQLLLLLLIGCFAGGGMMAARAQPRPDAEADLSALVEGSTLFAFELYRALRDEDGNLFFAPHSISAALAMLYAGARGETERQMAETLHFNLPQARLHQAYEVLNTALVPDARNAQGQDEEGFSLRVANALWGQSGYDFLPQYLELLSRHYGAGLQEVDFQTSPEQAREEINSWVGEQTEGHIEDLLPEGAVSAMTRLILTNAVYFKAAWLHTFAEELTEERAFTLLDETEVMVPMMQQTETFRYTQLDGLQIIELSYVGERLVMLVLLPDAGAFQEFEAALNPNIVGEAVNDLSSSRVRLTMPKFSYSSNVSLSSTLSNMGMPSAFLESADFSGLAARQELFIQDVLHEAFVLVDEEGTEAAAATGVAVGIASLEPEPIELMVDRPFIYLIRDLETGTVLFLGRVLNPLP
jgi:serpin B